MMRVNEFFYEQDEPPRFMCQTSAQQMIRDPKLYTTSQVAPTKPAEEKDKNKPLVMRVSICCNPCAELIESEIKKVPGVKTVTCEIYRKKVTVTGGSVADVLWAARKHFSGAKLWD